MLVLPQQCKSSTEQSQRGFELGTVLLWGNSNNQTTTVPPINVVPSALILVCHWSEDIYTQRCWNFKYIKYKFLWVFSLFKKKISYQRKTKQQCASLLKTIVHCTVNQKLPDVVTRGFSVSNATMTSWALGEVKCASLPRLSGVSRNGKRMRELFMEGEGGKNSSICWKNIIAQKFGIKPTIATTVSQILQHTLPFFEHSRLAWPPPNLVFKEKHSLKLQRNQQVRGADNNDAIFSQWPTWVWKPPDLSLHAQELCIN